MDMKRFKRSDLKLIAALLLAGLVLIALILCTRRDGRCAVVQVDGQSIVRLPLAENREYPVEIGGTVTNVLRIQDSSVRMAEANCPDLLCVHRGAIRYAGDSIVCLPNRVVVVITGEDALDLDAVAG